MDQRDHRRQGSCPAAPPFPLAGRRTLADGAGQLYLTKPDYDEGFLERILWDDRERVNSEEAYRKIYQSNSGALYFAQCENPNETWLPLLEKAYAKAHGDYSAIEGGFTGEGIEDLTGGVTSEIYTTDILDKVSLARTPYRGRAEPG